METGWGWRGAGWRLAGWRGGCWLEGALAGWGRLAVEGGLARRVFWGGLGGAVGWRMWGLAGGVGWRGG